MVVGVCGGTDLGFAGRVFFLDYPKAFVAVSIMTIDAIIDRVKRRVMAVCLVHLRTRRRFVRKQRQALEEQINLIFHFPLVCGKKASKNRFVTTMGGDALG